MKKELQERNFLKEKKDFLNKIDKSKKGSIDRRIRSLVGMINAKEDYYTTSSCSGRIVLYSPDYSGRKDMFKWIFVSHDAVSSRKIAEVLKRSKTNEVWLALEPVILHVGASDPEHAKKLLYPARDLGFRRSGIITQKKNKVVMELASTESVRTILRKDGVEADENYLRILVAESNRKLRRTWEKIKRLENLTERMERHALKKSKSNEKPK